jgi:hypothetical protein
MNEFENSPESPQPDRLTAPTFAAGVQPSYAHTLFLGPDGLRPGWGLAFYLVMFYPLHRLTSEWMFDWASKYVSLRASDALLELTALVAAVIPALVLARVEHRPWKAYGLPLGKAFGKLFWVGALWGFAAISVLLGILYGVGAFEFGHLALHGARIAKFAAYWAVIFLLVGLFEEFLLRGYTQFTLARGLGFWPAAVTLSCAFGLIHIGNGGENWLGILAAAAIGFFFCLTLRRTGSLWFAVGFHAAWDWGESFFYSVPDSGTISPGHLLSSSFHGSPWLTGGTVGPEGSVVCFVVMVLVWVLFDRVHPRAKSVTMARNASEIFNQPF